MPASVRDALARQAIPHRSPEFEAVFIANASRLAKVHGAKGPVVAMPGSGTTAFEAAALSLTNAGDRVVVAHAGKFGERWAQVFKRLGDRAGVRVETASRLWGEPIEEDDLARALSRSSEDDVKLVIVVHSETSTATAVDLERLAGVVHRLAPGALLLADCIGSVAAIPLEQDAWGVDVCVSASQKGLSAAAGLGFVSVGGRALTRLDQTHGLAPMALDLRWHLDALANGRPAATPPINLHFALAAALDVLDAKTLAGWLVSTNVRAHATREAVRALGLGLPSSAPSDAASAIEIPSQKAEDVCALARERFGVAFAGGHNAWKGAVVRISHMGAITSDNALSGVRAFAGALQALDLVGKADAVKAVDVASAALAKRESSNNGVTL